MVVVKSPPLNSQLNFLYADRVQPLRTRAFTKFCRFVVFECECGVLYFSNWRHEQAPLAEAGAPTHVVPNNKASYLDGYWALYPERDVACTSAWE